MLFFPYRPDGSFTVTGLLPGSYVIEVSNPAFFYEAVRVDITSKGKIRSRKVNYIQVTEVKQLAYPLKFKAKAQFKYFHARETWRITDMLMSPMVLMMVVPLLLVMVLPKLVSQEELQQTQKVTCFFLNCNFFLYLFNCFFLFSFSL